MNDERAIHPEFAATWFNMNPGARHESHSWKHWFWASHRCAWSGCGPRAREVHLPTADPTTGSGIQLLRELASLPIPRTACYVDVNVCMCLHEVIFTKFGRFAFEQKVTLSFHQILAPAGDSGVAGCARQALLGSGHVRFL